MALFSDLQLVAATKRRELALLAAMGADDGALRRAFLWLGLLLGGGGAILGGAAGGLLAWACDRWQLVRLPAGLLVFDSLPFWLRPGRRRRRGRHDARPHRRLLRARRAAGGAGLPGGGAARMSVTVRVRGLRKSFRDAHRTVEVLRGVDLDLAPGELVAVVGPSGSGKSTLLHLLGGLEPPDAGEIEIGGQRIDGLPAKRAGRLPQPHPRLRLPVPPAARRLHGARERRAAGADRRAGAGGDRPARRRAARRGRARRARSTASRASSRAASSSASRSAVRFCSSRRCCSPTSRPAASIRSPARRSSSSSSTSSGATGRPPSSSPTTRSWRGAVLGFWCSTTACSGAELSDSQVLPGAGRG